MITLITALIVCTSALLFPARCDKTAQHRFTIEAGRVIKVGDSHAAIQTIIGYAEAVDGYCLRQDDATVTLHIPRRSIDSLLNILDSVGIVVERKYSRRDLTDDYIKLQSSLNARTTLLDDYMTMLEQASDTTLFSVQRSVVALQEEIDQYTGRLRRLEYQCAFSTVTVSFDLPDRQFPTHQGKSNFAWLNQFSIDKLLWGYDR